ncbi:MAG TPA: hypothetical protein VK654_07255 [Nitrospirota bacterium]|nr:hypothetical protein [Nitrospirota bacterium]
MYLNLLFVALLVFLLNLPFGYWRANVRKFSFAWFVSVHAPVPFVIALRILSGLGFQFETLPIMLMAYFGGQLLGARLHSARRGREGVRVSSCLVWDLIGPVHRT